MADKGMRDKIYKLNIPKTLLHSVINTKNKYEIDGDISVEFEGTEKTNGLVYIYIKTDSISHQLEAIEREVEGLGTDVAIENNAYVNKQKVLAIIKKYKEGE